MIFQSEEFASIYRHARLPILLLIGGGMVLASEELLLSLLIDAGVIYSDATMQIFRTIIPVTSWGALLLGAGLALDRYLRYGFLRTSGVGINLGSDLGMKSEAPERRSRWAAEIDRKLKELESVFREKDLSGGENLDQAQQAELMQLLVRRVEESSVEFLSQAAIERASTYLSERSVDRLHEQFRRSLSRMTGEVESLGRRGNLNLIIGILATISGFVIFGLLILEVGSLIDTSDYLVTHFVPRLSLVVLIEIFAYFFLGLYKSSLTEIKYFQNEITNLEARYLALEQAIFLGDKPTIKKLLDHISKTERNFLIKKGESTISLETGKLSSQQQSNLVTAVTNALISTQERLTKPSSRRQ